MKDIIDLLQKKRIKTVGALKQGEQHQLSCLQQIVNNISGFNSQFWRIGDLGLYETKHPINIDSLNGDFVAWFDVGNENFPTEKQLATWEDFCKISPTNMKEMIIEGLTKLSRQMDLLLADIKPQYGPVYNPKAVSRNAKKAIEGFPKNVNVAVASAIASVGTEDMQVEITSCPGEKNNIHRITTENNLGKAVIEITSKPDPENPRSSIITAWSIVALLENLAGYIQFF